MSLELLFGVKLNIPTHFTDMDSAVKTKWLEALRSGEYKQARYMLRSCSGGFCCLGVLSDLYRKEVGGSWEWDYNQDSAYSIVHEDPEDFGATQIPVCIVEWAGLEDRNPEVHVAVGDSDFVPTTLAELNDEGKGFEYIADVIDHQL